MFLRITLVLEAMAYSLANSQYIFAVEVVIRAWYTVGSATLGYKFIKLHTGVEHFVPPKAT